MFLLAAALTILETITLQGPLHHVQGIDVEGDTLWVSSVNKAARKGYLFRIQRHTGRILVQVEVQDGERYHPGGLSLDGDTLWLPVAEYRRTSSAVIQRRDKRTLRLLSQFPVNDHIGCVAAGGGRLFGGNWDSREIYEWDRNGTMLAKRPSETGTTYQDLKFVEGLLVGGGKRGATRGAIDWLDPASLTVKRRMEVETTNRGTVFTNEGMAIREGRIFLLPEDDPSRLFVVQP